MNAQVPPAPDVPVSTRKRSPWPNLIWTIPAVALLVVGYLGFEAFRHRGETITVTFARAAGARAGDTKVLYQGVEAGQLVKIEPNKDGRSLDFKLRMVPEAKPGLNSNARFWLIGATPTFTDLSSLRAVLTGVAIGYAPGEGGTPSDTFQGLEKAPIILPSDKGVRFRLHARELDSAHEGSLVLFHGQTIGKVSDVKFDGKSAFDMEIFVYEPFDALITSDARFWKISPLRLSFKDGISASLPPVPALLAGGIGVDVHPVGAEEVSPAAPGQQFTLYESRSAARAGLAGPTVTYEFLFDGDAGTLQREAAVTLLGFEIGEVRSVRLMYDSRSGEPQTLALADIYPRQLRLEPGTGQGDAWRAATDTKLAQLIRSGYRAHLTQVPVLFGSTTIALVKTRGAASARLDVGDHGRFPTVAGGGLDDVTTQASALLSNLNSVPFGQIGSDLRIVTDRMKRLLASPDLPSSLAHLSASLASLDAILSEAKPQIGPLMTRLEDTANELAGVAGDAHRLLQSNGSDANLNDAIQELGDAARSIRALSDYLSRHPEALLRGKSGDP